MSNQANPMVWKTTEIPKTPSRLGRLAELEIDVVFTSSEATIAALKRASELSRDLGASIRLVVPHVVPYKYPLDRPPVAVGFTRERMLDLVLKGLSADARVTIDLYLGRERQKTLFDVLKPNSLVIIGGRRRWWATEDSRLAKALRSRGHQVVFIDLK